MEKKLEDVYFFHLERTTRQFRQFSKRVLAENGYDITGEQWVLLKRAHEMPGIIQSDLAESTYKDRASVTRTLDLLEIKGLVKRQKTEGDRRSYSIHLTKKGKKLVDDVLPIAKKMRKKGLQGINDKEAVKLISMLEKIYENLE